MDAYKHHNYAAVRWIYCEMTLGTALADFKPGQFKTWMKKMAAQVDAFLSRVQYGARKLALVCSIKILLTTYLGVRRVFSNLMLELSNSSAFYDRIPFNMYSSVCRCFMNIFAGWLGYFCFCVFADNPILMSCRALGKAPVIICNNNVFENKAIKSVV